MEKTIHVEEYRTLLKWLHDARKQRGMSLRELAERVGVHHSRIGRIETGERRLDILEYMRFLPGNRLRPRRRPGFGREDAASKRLGRRRGSPHDLRNAEKAVQEPEPQAQMMARGRKGRSQRPRLFPSLKLLRTSRGTRQKAPTA